MVLSNYFRGVIVERLKVYGIDSIEYIDKVEKGIQILEKMLWLRYDKKDAIKRQAQIEKALTRYNDEIIEIAKQYDAIYKNDHDAMIRAFRIRYTNLYKDSENYCHNVNGSKKVSVNISNVREFLDMKEEEK